ncbi:MAG: hypothetical protein WA821_21455 [Anaerolineales bacterium]
MKLKSIPILLLLVVAFLPACAPGGISGQALPIAPVETATTQTATVAPSPSATPDRKAEIIQEIKQKAADFNAFVEAEQKTGTTVETVLPNGEKGFVFTNDTQVKVMNEETLVRDQIAKLNKEYYELRLRENPLAPTPTFPADRAARQALSDRITEEFSTWQANELKHGETVTLYPPTNDDFAAILIGESYVLDEEKANQVSALYLSLKVTPSPDMVKLDIQAIQRLEPGDVTLTDIGAFPYYRSDIDLTTYETSSRVYIVYTKSHQIIEIDVKEPPQTSSLTAIAPLSQAELEKKARAFVAVASPGVDLDALTPAGGSKINTFFFRWEDRTKPVLDDGMSYPFVQVGYNSDGELLGYYNTLPLSR